jgi:hypothetical protein
VFDTHTLHLEASLRNQKDALNKSLNNQPHETKFFPCFSHLERIAFLKKSHAKILSLKIEKEPTTRPQSEI